eukprot:scaffold259789_cov30-Tisochrysis_lutea.AAC.3
MHNVVQDVTKRDALVGISAYVLADISLRASTIGVLGSALNEYAMPAGLLLWAAAVCFTFLARALQVRAARHTETPLPRALLRATLMRRAGP